MRLLRLKIQISNVYPSKGGVSTSRLSLLLCSGLIIQANKKKKKKKNQESVSSLDFRDVTEAGRKKLYRLVANCAFLLASFPDMLFLPFLRFSL